MDKCEKGLRKTCIRDKELRREKEREREREGERENEKDRR